jgi:hypothetical protein
MLRELPGRLSARLSACDGLVVNLRRPIKR